MGGPVDEIFKAPDPFRLAELLKREGVCSRLEVLRSCASTNTEALKSVELGEKGFPFAVLAAEQCAGRGRLGRKWFGKCGASIFLSVAVKVPKKAELIESFTVRAGIEICETLSRECGAELFLKWPNDIYSRDGKKLAGMLAELKIFPDKDHGAIVFGVGLNYDFSEIPESEIPEEIRGRIADLKSLAKRRVSIDAAVAAVIKSVILTAENTDVSGLSERFAAVDWLAGREVCVELGGDTFSGVAVGVDERGFLKVELPGGKIRKVCGGEASLGGGA